VAKRLRVVLGGEVIADTTAGYRVLETSSPPSYYFPPADIVAGALERSTPTSVCEWKGAATYYTVHGGQGRVVRDGAWGYDDPAAGFEPIAHYVAFYATGMDACCVGDEQVVPQPGGYYGGWITADLVGPFKGVPGSLGW
jgi:uncharacterized protein (DUF427 family)